jgi:hypothetical protein
LKQTVFEKTQPANMTELREAVELAIARRYSDEELRAIKDEQLALIDELRPDKEERFEEWAKAVESANYVRRVLERTAGKTLS